MKYSYSDIHETCSYQDYVDQYNPIKLEVGEVYTQHPDTWEETEYKVMYIHNKIAFAVETRSKYPAVTKEVNYCLFYVDSGFKYKDTVRPCYRLQAINKK